MFKLISTCVCSSNFVDDPSTASDKTAAAAAAAQNPLYDDVASLRARSLSVDLQSLGSSADASELADQFNVYPYADNAAPPTEAGDFRRRKATTATTPGGASTSSSTVGPNGEHIKHIGGRFANDGFNAAYFCVVVRLCWQYD